MRKLPVFILLLLVTSLLFCNIAFAQGDDLVYVGEGSFGRTYVEPSSVDSYYDQDNILIASGKIWTKVSEAYKSKVPRGTEVVVWEQTFKSVDDQSYVKIGHGWYLDEKGNTILEDDKPSTYRAIKKGSLAQMVARVVVDIALEKNK